MNPISNSPSGSPPGPSSSTSPTGGGGPPGLGTGRPPFTGSRPSSATNIPMGNGSQPVPADQAEDMLGAGSRQGSRPSSRGSQTSPPTPHGEPGVSPRRPPSSLNGRALNHTANQIDAGTIDEAIKLIAASPKETLDRPILFKMEDDDINGDKRTMVVKFSFDAPDSSGISKKIEVTFKDGNSTKVRNIRGLDVDNMFRSIKDKCKSKDATSGIDDAMIKEIKEDMGQLISFAVDAFDDHKQANPELKILRFMGNADNPEIWAQYGQDEDSRHLQYCLQQDNGSPGGYKWGVMNKDDTKEYAQKLLESSNYKRINPHELYDKSFLDEILKDISMPSESMLRNDLLRNRLRTVINSAQNGGFEWILNYEHSVLDNQLCLGWKINSILSKYSAYADGSHRGAGAECIIEDGSVAQQQPGIAPGQTAIDNANGQSMVITPGVQNGPQPQGVSHAPGNAGVAGQYNDDEYFAVCPDYRYAYMDENASAVDGQLKINNYGQGQLKNEGKELTKTYCGKLFPNYQALPGFVESKDLHTHTHKVVESYKQYASYVDMEDFERIEDKDIKGLFKDSFNGFLGEPPDPNNMDKLREVFNGAGLRDNGQDIDFFVGEFLGGPFSDPSGPHDKLILFKINYLIKHARQVVMRSSNKADVAEAAKALTAAHEMWNAYKASVQNHDAANTWQAFWGESEKKRVFESTPWSTRPSRKDPSWHKEKELDNKVIELGYYLNSFGRNLAELGSKDPATTLSPEQKRFFNCLLAYAYDRINIDRYNNNTQELDQSLRALRLANKQITAVLTAQTTGPTTSAPLSFDDMNHSVNGEVSPKFLEMKALWKLADCADVLGGKGDKLSAKTRFNLMRFLKYSNHFLSEADDKLKTEYIKAAEPLIDKILEIKSSQNLQLEKDLNQQIEKLWKHSLCSRYKNSFENKNQEFSVGQFAGFSYEHRQEPVSCCFASDSGNKLRLFDGRGIIEGLINDIQSHTVGTSFAKAKSDQREQYIKDRDKVCADLMKWKEEIKVIRPKDVLEMIKLFKYAAWLSRRLNEKMGMSPEERLAVGKDMLDALRAAMAFGKREFVKPSRPFASSKELNQPKQLAPWVTGFFTGQYSRVVSQDKAKTLRTEFVVEWENPGLQHAGSQPTAPALSGAPASGPAPALAGPSGAAPAGDTYVAWQSINSLQGAMKAVEGFKVRQKELVLSEFTTKLHERAQAEGEVQENNGGFASTLRSKLSSFKPRLPQFSSTGNRPTSSSSYRRVSSNSGNPSPLIPPGQRQNAGQPSSTSLPGEISDQGLPGGTARSPALVVGNTTNTGLSEVVNPLASLPPGSQVTGITTGNSQSVISDSSASARNYDDDESGSDKDLLEGSVSSSASPASSRSSVSSAGNDGTGSESSSDAGSKVSFVSQGSSSNHSK